jgi:DsbC/DsbD-like thiol-disulfide interchange protein
MPSFRTLLFVLLATGTLALALLPNAEKPDVRARVDAPASLDAGAKGRIAVEMKLGSGWHVNSHTPSETYLIPTVVTLTASRGTLSPVRYPKDVEKQFSFSEKPLRVYEGTVRFEADLDLPADAIGPASIRGSLSYQACNDRQCFPPGKILLEASVAVSDAGKSGSLAHRR